MAISKIAIALAGLLAACTSTDPTDSDYFAQRRPDMRQQLAAVQKDIDGYECTLEIAAIQQEIDEIRASIRYLKQEGCCSRSKVGSNGKTAWGDS